MSKSLDAWNISADDFPANSNSEEKLWFLLNYAILAPSSHNTQPWRFRVHGNEVELYADLSRALRVVDPFDRELIMSCGAALFHLRLATEYFGHSCRVEISSEANDPSLLARVRLGFHCETPSADIALFHAIARRRTNRLPFQATPLPEALLAELQHAAASEGAWLHFVSSDEARNAVADLVAQADRIQWADKHFRQELASWVHPNDSTAHDGMPGYAHGLSDWQSKAEAFAIRTFDLGKGQAAKDRDIAAHSPVLAVLGTDADGPQEWLSAGQALAKVLLEARSEEVWASFLNQPIEVPELRPRLSEVIGHSGSPQILLRLGYGAEVRPTPRRSVREVLIYEQPRKF